jgi:hypothetical protein
VLVVDDCRAAYDRLRTRGVEFIREPIARFGGVDANFRDPSGNAWKMIDALMMFAHACRDHRPDVSAKLTTTAFDRSSLRWLGIGS